MDENLRKLIEPNGVESNKRFEMLKTFRNTNASVGLHVMPIIPYLTDSFENINSLFSKAKESDVHYVLPGTLYLRGQTRVVFFDLIKEKFGYLYDDLSALYKIGGSDKEYKNKLYKMINELRDKYKLSSSYMSPMREKLNQSENKQISFLDELSKIR